MEVGRKRGGSSSYSLFTFPRVVSSPNPHPPSVISAPTGPPSGDDGEDGGWGEGGEDTVVNRELVTQEPLFLQFTRGLLSYPRSRSGK